MDKKTFIKGILTIVIAALTAALSFFFASCSTQSHLELKHSSDSLIIRKDNKGTISSPKSSSKIAIPTNSKKDYYYVSF